APCMHWAIRAGRTADPILTGSPAWVSRGDPHERTEGADAYETDKRARRAGVAGPGGVGLGPGLLLLPRSDALPGTTVQPRAVSAAPAGGPHGPASPAGSPA